MSNEILTQDQAQTAASANMLAIIARAAADSTIDTNKMLSLLEMQKDIMKQQAKIDFDVAMSRLQPNLPQIHKASKGHNCTYANYESVDKAVRHLYTKEGFSISFDTKGATTYVGTISHVSGYSKTVEIDFPLDTSGNKPAIQAKISSLSYAKRNLLQMLLNIVTTGEDDDGAAAGYDLVTHEQAVEIDLMIPKDPAYKIRFLKFIGAKDVQSIHADDYQKAVDALNEYKKAQEKHAAKAPK